MSQEQRSVCCRWILRRQEAQLIGGAVSAGKLAECHHARRLHLLRLADADKPCLSKELAAPGAANSILPSAPIIDDSMGPRDPTNLADAEAASGVVRIAAADASSSALSHLSLAGFCPVSFVKRAGLLVKAESALGFVRYTVHSTASLVTETGYHHYLDFIRCAQHIQLCAAAGAQFCWQCIDL